MNLLLLMKQFEWSTFDESENEFCALYVIQSNKSKQKSSGLEWNVHR